MSFGITTDERGWDSFATSNGACFLQSWGWSQFQESIGREVYRVRISSAEGEGQESGTKVQFILIGHKLPFGFKYLYVPRGPIVMDGDVDSVRQGMEVGIGAAHDASARAGAVFARVDWPVVSEGGAISAARLSEMGFIQSGHVQPKDTVILDLTKSEEEILSTMKQKTRYNIRLSERHGVTVSEAEYDNAHMLRNDAELFWRLLAETSERDKFNTHDQEYYAKMIDVLNPKRHKGGELVVRLMFASHEGEAIAGGLFAEYGDTVTYLHGASLSAKRSVMAPYKLHWEVIRYARERGFKKYDFWGVAPEGASSDHPWHGVTRFKMGFGGYRKSYLGAWDLPRQRLAYAGYRLMKRLRGR